MFSDISGQPDKVEYAGRVQQRIYAGYASPSQK